MDETTETPIKSVYNRKPDGKFGADNIANPNGRPLKENTFSDIARELASASSIDINYTILKDGQMVKRSMHMESNKTMAHSMVAALIKEGLDGNVAAIKEFANRTEGKVMEKIKMIYDEDIEKMTNEELAKFVLDNKNENE